MRPSCGMADPKPIWAIVPAAGIGQRMGSDVPKQYLSCAGAPVLEHSIKTLLAVERVAGVIVALNAEDSHWDTLSLDNDKPVHTLTGGAERYESVELALAYLRQHIMHDEPCLALVHDAVRPCVRMSDIDRLIDKVLSDGNGAILAAPVKDTMKRVDDQQHVLLTVVRDHLWHAQTPQLFDVDELSAALQQASSDGLRVTDESSAMELAGYPVNLVSASDTNIKITREEDLMLAEFYLSGDR